MLMFLNGRRHKLYSKYISNKLVSLIKVWRGTTHFEMNIYLVLNQINEVAILR